VDNSGSRRLERLAFEGMTRGAWRLPGYRVEDLIGAGSSGEVWRATVTSTGVPVAHKRIWLSERAQRQAAISEAAMLSALDHPHLMKLHEVRPVDDAIVLVLDLAAAGSLATLLSRRGRLTVGETITALAPIGGALAYAHNAGVVHGDVSSANILFTEVGLPLLADLGVSRLLGDAAAVRTTPSYADPAVAAGGLPAPASDVFMLGAVALHALTGAPPWPGDEAAEVLELAATTGVEPDFERRLNAAGIPIEVATIVLRALQLVPDERCTAAEFALELRHAAEPVAVELTAGRARHAARTLESWPLESVPPALAAGSSRSVRLPPFARQPLTDGVRAPTPFTQPPGERHLARQSRLRRSAVVAAVLVVLAVIAAVFWPGGSSPASRVVDSRSGHTVATAVSRSPSASVPTSSSPTPTALAASSAYGVLVALDHAPMRAATRPC
jgi:serine/threonine protein kinase